MGFSIKGGYSLVYNLPIGHRTLPNINEGLLISKLQQKTGSTFDDNVRYTELPKPTTLIMSDCKFGIEIFNLSGYPYLEEVYTVA